MKVPQDDEATIGPFYNFLYFWKPISKINVHSNWTCSRVSSGGLESLLFYGELIDQNKPISPSTCIKVTRCRASMLNPYQPVAAQPLPPAPVAFVPCDVASVAFLRKWRDRSGTCRPAMNVTTKD